MRVQWNSGEFQKLLKSAPREIVDKEAQRIADEAASYPQSAESKEYGVRSGTSDRARASVFPKTPHAHNSNAKHNTLVKLAGGPL